MLNVYLILPTKLSFFFFFFFNDPAPTKIYPLPLHDALPISIPVFARAKKVKISRPFVEGANGGFEGAVKIIPPLVAIIVALDMLKATSGGMIFTATSK